MSLAACKPGPGVQQKTERNVPLGEDLPLVFSVPARSSASAPVQDRLLVIGTLGAQDKAARSCEPEDLHGAGLLGLSVGSSVVHVDVFSLSEGQGWGVSRVCLLRSLLVSQRWEVLRLNKKLGSQWQVWKGGEAQPLAADSRPQCATFFTRLNCWLLIGSAIGQRQRHQLTHALA